MVFFSFSYKILKFQIIYLIRDPRAIYASMTKLKQAKSTWKDRLSKFGSVVCENMLNDFYLSHIIPPERYACTGVIYSIVLVYLLKGTSFIWHSAFWHLVICYTVLWHSVKRRHWLCQLSSKEYELI